MHKNGHNEAERADDCIGVDANKSRTEEAPSEGLAFKMATQNKESFSNAAPSLSKSTDASSYHELQGSHNSSPKESIAVPSEYKDCRTSRPDAALVDEPASAYVFASGFVSGSGRLSALEIGYRSLLPRNVTDQNRGSQCVSNRADYDRDMNAVRGDGESFMEYLVR